MKLDHTKAAIWVAVILMISSAFVFWNEREEPTPLPAPPPAAEVVAPVPSPPVPPTVVAPPIVEPSVTAPAVTAPVTKARPPHRATPAPAPAVKPKLRAKTKCAQCGPKAAVKRKRRLDCHLVPPEAYTHAEFLVIGAARQRGINESGITLLKACLAQHAKGGD